MLKRGKKLVAAALAGILAVSSMGVLPQTGVAYAQEIAAEEAELAATVNFTNLPVTVLSDMDDYDLKTGLSWQIDWDAKEDDADSCVRYGKFTIKKDSIVRIRTTYEGDKGTIGIQSKYDIYGNSSMGTSLYSIYADGSDDYFELKAGTYYVKMTCQMKYDKTEVSYTSKMSIGSIAKSSTVKASQKVNKTKTKVTVKINENIISDGNGSVKYVAGKYTDNISWDYNSKVKDISVGTSFTVKENGWYTVRVVANSTKAFSNGAVIYKHIKVTGIDDKKPAVTGVKNKKTYKKSVTIKFKDNKGGSGIKSATLNGKKIKSGKVVKKAGKYTLKVKDKAGNVKTVTFTIKKK